ncbi:DUF7535 family protein [Natronomonas amylolytica]|uniref:DUF7535 family protein n=1 Tax=Natronomonas amylolytica TaxID=3108498 RepID=UPI003009FA18
MVEGIVSTGQYALRDRVSRDGETSGLWLAAGAGLLLLLVPLLPFLLIVWMISRTLKDVRREVSWE